MWWWKTCLDMRWMQTEDQNGGEGGSRSFPAVDEHWKMQQVFGNKKNSSRNRTAEWLGPFKNDMSVHVLFKFVGFRRAGR